MSFANLVKVVPNQCMRALLHEYPLRVGRRGPPFSVTLRRSHTAGMKSKVHPRYKTKYRVANWAGYNQRTRSTRRCDGVVVRGGDRCLDARPERPAGWAAAVLGGVVARIVTGPHDAHRQDPHRPMRFDTSRPRAVIRFRISQPRTTSLPCPAGLRARRPSPMMDVYRKNAFSTRP